MDELYSFVERKNRIYVMTLVSRDKRQILGYDIALDKSRERIQKLIDNSAKASNITLRLILPMQKFVTKVYTLL